MRTKTERTLQPGCAGARRVRGMGRHLAVGCLAQQASRPSRRPRAPPPPLGDGGPGERERHRETDRVDCARIVHLAETCEDDAVNLITHAMTTVATVHEARCTAAIHEALAGKGLVPGEHLVDAAYVDAELLVRSRDDHGIDLVGPPRPNPSWQAKLEGGYTPDRFEVDWDKGQVRCPQGRLSSAWNAPVERSGAPYIRVQFRAADCGACPARPLCARAGQARHLRLHPRAEHEAPKGGPGGARAGGGSTRRSGAPEGGSRRGRAGAPTRGGPGSRAPSRRTCARSGCAAAGIAGWPRRICSTSPPRPRSTSSVSPPGSARPRVPPPASPASPPWPPDPTSPTVSTLYVGFEPN